MVKKNKIRKEDIAEDWCFVCKDGGLLMVCDHRDCRKSYHPRCVDKDDSFLENGSEWTCSSHFCFLCHKASKFRCFCCPKAICGKCISDAEFAIVKGNKGFCSHCLKLAFLIEDDADIDSDGELVDFKDQDTYEFLFSEYYEIIKKEEGLNSEHVHSAHRFFKNGKSKCDFDPDEIGLGEDGSSGSEDVSNYIVSDCDDLNDTAGSMSGRTKKGLGKLKSMKGSGKDKKKEFIGWGSRSLMEFLEYIGKETSNEFSEHDVTSIIIEYCRENNLFDPKKKRKIHCDAPLRSLLRRKSVNRNSMQNLLAQHFAENFEEMGDISSSSEDIEYSEPSNLSRKRKSISCTKSHDLNIVCEEHQSCFAAIVSSNLKLVYLKRSLVDELSKQPQTFDDKVLGSYVRIKTDPYDYLQKNSHLLVQVVGINRSLRNDEINKEIMLQLSHVPKNVPISKISDDDFSEEECQDLYQRMKNGLLKQPTVLELEQKARSLHEDIMKHWIPRKLVLLQNCIDHANEKGWRREYPFMIYSFYCCLKFVANGLSIFSYQKLKLETQLEQSRLLNDIPKVIPEIVDTALSREGSPRIDKLEQNGLSELASGQTCNSVGHYSKHSGFAHSLNNRTDIAASNLSTRRTVLQLLEGKASLDRAIKADDILDSFLSFVIFLSYHILRTRQSLPYPILYSIYAVERIVQDVENDKGVPTIDSSQPGGDKSQSNKVLHVYTRRNLQQKKVQPIIPTPEQMDSIISPDNVPGPKSPVKENQEGTDFPVASTASQDKDTSQRNLPQSSTTTKARQNDPEAKLFEKLGYPAKYGLCQPRNTESGSVIINGRNLCATLYAEETIKEKQSISVASVNDKQDTSISANPVEEKELSTPTKNVIVLSDDDEEETIVGDISSGRKAGENPDISIWHCVGPCGERGGPYKMSTLKRWTGTSSNPLEFKVWKTGQSETEAISLTDALKRFFSNM
ncbi:hypothetical protein VNO80_29811 [Phaseolus coccineus]|uniref:Zinc finger PHD-type domain-containing protein n=1 Tax=Phaseolus coccineus TaxID=3886 RepID=A0AAN9QFE7_PHACN